MKSEYHGLGSLGGSSSLSNAIPQPLGVPAPGVGGAASRDDHVHQMPALEELTNVSPVAPASGAVLTYNGTTSQWEPGLPGPSQSVEPYVLMYLAIV